MWIQVPLLLHSEEVKYESNKLSYKETLSLLIEIKMLITKQRESEGWASEINKVSETTQEWSFSETLEREVDPQYPEVIEIN